MRAKALSKGGDHSIFLLWHSAYHHLFKNKQKEGKKKKALLTTVRFLNEAIRVNQIYSIDENNNIIIILS
jgi:hypothetical protein